MDRSPDDAPALARLRPLLRAALRLVTGEPSRWPPGAWAEAARAELGDGGPAGEPYDYGPFLR